MLSFVSRPMVVALIVACALFMENLDGTVITTALPAMAASFGDTPVRLSLGVTVYMISLAIFIPVSGWVADRFGARTVFRAAIAVFTLGSILCGLCDNLPELAAARVLQGIGGAMMVPVGRLILLRSVAKSELVRAMAYLTVPALLGPVLGPPVGGFITTYANWRWIFFLNLPIGILGMALVSLFIENYQTEKSPPLDWLGFLLSGFALAGLVYGLDLIGRSTDGPVVIGAILCASLLVGALAVLHFRRHPHPLIDLSLLRVPTYAASVVGGSIFRIGPGARRLHHEDDGAADPARPRLSPGAHRQRHRQRPGDHALRPVPADDALCPDSRRPAVQRILSLAAIHQPEHRGLCRYRRRPDERRVERRQHDAAADERAGRGGRRLAAAIDAAMGRRRHADSGGLPHRLRGDGADLAVVGAVLPESRSGRRRRGQRPSPPQEARYRAGQRVRGLSRGVTPYQIIVATERVAAVYRR